MASTNDAFHQSAIEKFNDAFKNQAAANGNDGYFKVPNRTPSSVSEPPLPTSSLAERAQLTGSYYNPAANGNDGYFKVPNRTPPPPPPFEPPKPQKISDSFYQRELRYQQGLTQGRSLNDNPGFRNPNPLAADQMPIPTSAGGKGLLPKIGGADATSFGVGIGLIVIPGLIQQGPNFLNPNNPNGIFAPDPRYTEAQKALQQENERLRRNADNTLRNMGIPPWLNPFKNSKPGELPPKPGDKPNAESKKWFPVATDISFYSPNNKQYLTLSVLSYAISSIGERSFASSEVFLREGTDHYLITWDFFESFDPVIVGHGNTIIEPWTLQNLGPSIGNHRNPEDPTNIVPETDKPFLPPHVPNWHGYDQASPPTILDPNDFKSPSASPPLSPMFPPTLPPIPKPFDPIQKPEPTNPKEEKPAPIIPPSPFNPFQTPPTPNPIQNPPPFEPGPVNPNQRLNDRGIFPARKADITATVSGSPLSPDIEIGGDPVRLTTPAPQNY